MYPLLRCLHCCKTLVAFLHCQMPAADSHKRFEVDFNFPRRSLSEALTAAAATATPLGESGQPTTVQEVTLGALDIATDMVFHVRML
jgi:hypothetical protein